MQQPTLVTMSFGLAVFITSLGAWIYGATIGLDTSILWGVTTPLVLGLFIGQQVAHAAEQSQKAADQTNGVLTARIENVVTRVVRETLSARDTARTRQALGDVGPVAVETPVPVPVHSEDGENA